MDEQGNKLYRQLLRLLVTMTKTKSYLSTVDNIILRGSQRRRGGGDQNYFIIFVTLWTDY